MRYTSLLAAPVIAAAGVALALSSAGVAAAEPSALQTQGEVTFVTGGLAKADADAILHAAPYYPLQLEFLLETEPRDTYLSGVKIWIKDAHDKMVLDVAGGGPLLIARLPAGRYTISADHGGVVKTRVIQITPGRHERAVFEWMA